MNNCTEDLEDLKALEARLVNEAKSTGMRWMTYETADILKMVQSLCDPNRRNWALAILKTVEEEENRTFDRTGLRTLDETLRADIRICFKELTP